MTRSSLGPWNWPGSSSSMLINVCSVSGHICSSWACIRLKKGLNNLWPRVAGSLKKSACPHISSSSRCMTSCRQRQLVETREALTVSIYGLCPLKACCLISNDIDTGSSLALWHLASQTATHTSEISFLLWLLWHPYPSPGFCLTFLCLFQCLYFFLLLLNMWHKSQVMNSEMFIILIFKITNFTFCYKLLLC